MARKVGGEAAIHARIAAAPGLGTEDSHRLAGLLEAECHLAVARNNTDGWRCSCAIALRDDDRDILESFRNRLGIGHLNQIAARNGSRPQVCWIVESKAECAALVDLLDAHPMRGRKLAQYEVWRAAVGVWAARRYGLSPTSRIQLDEAAKSLGAARVYRPPAEGDVPPRMHDPDAAFFFAGFFSGEGCFQLQARGARFVTKLRRDDRPLLDAFRHRFAIGHVNDISTPPPWSPQAVWTIAGASDVLTGIALFDAAGLLGRKRRQFLAWKPGALAVARAKIVRGPLDARSVDTSRRALTEETAYKPPADSLTVDRGYRDARSAYLAILRDWAESTDGRLSCTAYQAARAGNPHWPKSETIAFSFGSWYEALRTAGLEDRAVRRPSAA